MHHVEASLLSSGCVSDAGDPSLPAAVTAVKLPAPALKFTETLSQQSWPPLAHGVFSSSRPRLRLPPSLATCGRIICRSSAIASRYSTQLMIAMAGLAILSSPSERWRDQPVSPLSPGPESQQSRHSEVRFSGGHCSTIDATTWNGVRPSHCTNSWSACRWPNRRSF